ncbi:MAG: hypothetical protein ABI597_04100 [Gammaproteobacteria bacterium]
MIDKIFNISAPTIQDIQENSKEYFKTHTFPASKGSDAAAKKIIFDVTMEEFYKKEIWKKLNFIKLINYSKLQIIRRVINMLRTIPTEISEQARVLHKKIQEEKSAASNDIAKALLKIAHGEHLPPDDWASIQETIDITHPCAPFFSQHRNAISRQLIFEGRKFTAVPIITFSYLGERYVLLMKNIGLEKSADVAEVQWTAHGVRVDAHEEQLQKNLWKLYEKVSHQDGNLTYFVAAAVRRLSEIGIKMNEADISNIHLIDRSAAGFRETSSDYRTEYLDFNLGERDPLSLMQSCAMSNSRYAQWTQCFKLSDLKAKVKEDQFAKREKKKYTLSYQDQDITVRETTWCFVKALQLLAELEIKPDSITKDPWQLRNINSFETALRWVQQRMDSSVQFTLFSPEVSRLSSAQSHAYAAKASLNEENFAYTALRPERLVLHVIIATLTTRTILKDSKELETRARFLYEKFFEKNISVKEKWEKIFESMTSSLKLIAHSHINDTNSDQQRLSSEDSEDIKCIRQLLDVIKTTKLDERHSTIYHLYESDLEIAIQIRLHEKYHKMVMSDIRNKIEKLIDAEDKFMPLEKYSLSDRLCFGISGPVASGKSVSEKMIRTLLGKKNAAYIGSDEWNIILSEFLKLDKTGFNMHRGNLTLPEAWFIKVLIWEMINDMEKQGQAPNWIHETCSPLAIKPATNAKTVIIINTADPTKAVERVKKRGDQSGRYVSASAAASSYRWPWLNFIKLLENKTSNTVIKVIDTDIMYSKLSLAEAERMMLANIISVETDSEGKRILDIHNFNHFLFFVSRGLRVNPSPKNAKEIWLPKKADISSLLLKEIELLFKPALGLSIKINGKAILKFKEISDRVDKIYFVYVRPIEQFWQKRQNVIKITKESKIVPSSNMLGV